MLPCHLALISQDQRVPLSALADVAAALQKQITRDFTPIWGIPADVGVFANLQSMPHDYWPIIIRPVIADPLPGFHKTSAGQPYALVRYSPQWPLTVSHEALEMLCDPFGSRLVGGPSPIPVQGRVQFLVEVCDPCEAFAFAYPVNGIGLSDFYTPRFFDPVAAPGVRYSFNASIVQPRQVREGGYLTWIVPATQRVWQRRWFNGPAPIDIDVTGVPAVTTSLREAVDRVTAADRSAAMNGGGADPDRTGAMRQEPSFKAHAKRLQGEIDALLKAAPKSRKPPRAKK